MNVPNNTCNKSSNNKYFDCPPIMNDGRHFTDYRPDCYVNNIMRIANKTYSSYDYRQFLINNAQKIMNVNNKYNNDKNGSGTCDARPVPEEIECTYGTEYGLCKNLNNNGVGLRNKYNSSSSERIYNPGQQTREMVSKDNVKYARNEPHAGSPGIRCETFVPYRYN